MHVTQVVQYLASGPRMLHPVLRCLAACIPPPPGPEPLRLSPCFGAAGRLLRGAPGPLQAEAPVPASSAAPGPASDSVDVSADIYNGQPASLSAFPWMVDMKVWTQGQASGAIRLSHMCGGSLIAADVVLTGEGQGVGGGGGWSHGRCSSVGREATAL